MDCLFCKIIKGEIPAYKIYEDDMVIAFLDINPRDNGHTLIVPKKHFETLYEMEEETLLHINQVVKKLVPELQEKLGATSFHINNNYLDNIVNHYHVHIVPNFKRPVEEIYNMLKQ